MFKKYSFALISVMLALIFVMLVFLISGLDKAFHLKADLSANGIFRLSEVTKGVLDTLDEDIRFYYLSEENRESSYIKEVLERYERHSGNISVKTVDMIKDPMFLNKYTSDDSIDKGSIIVESDKRFTVVSPEAAIKIQTSSNNGTVSYSVGFELEKLLTNAVDYVISDREIKVGYVSGHEGADFSVTVQKLKGENIAVSEVNIDGKINEYDVIIFFGIKKDISAEEEKLVKEYLSEGKNLCIISNPGVECPRLYKIAEDYGISVNNDILSQGDPSKVIYNEKHCFEVISKTHKITENIGNKKLLVPFASSLELTDKAVGLLMSSDTVRSYEVLENKEGSFIKADSFCTAAIGKKEKSSLLMISTTQMFNTGNEVLTNAIDSADYVNNEFFAQSIKYMANPNGHYISVLPKNIASRSIAVTMAQKSALIIIFGFLLPALVLISGVIVYLRRKNL